MGPATPINDELSAKEKEVIDLDKEIKKLQAKLRKKRKNIDFWREENQKTLTKERRLFNNFWFREWQRLVREGLTDLKDWRDLPEPKKKKFS